MLSSSMVLNSMALWSLRSMPCTNLVSERLACALALSYHSSAMSLVSHALMSRTLRGLHDIDVDIYFNVGIDLVVYIVVCPSSPARAARSRDSHARCNQVIKMLTHAMSSTRLRAMPL